MSLRTLSRHAEAGSLAKPDKCEGCGEEWEFGGWEIHHGWARCANCGTAYCILDYEDDEDYDGPKLVFTDEFVEAISEFYDEFGTRWDEDERFDDFVEENYPELIPNE